MLLDNKSRILLNVERAANDLRKGFPVIIRNKDTAILVASAETISPDIFHNIKKDGTAKIVITEKRANFLYKNDSFKTNVSANIYGTNKDDIAVISGISHNKHEPSDLFFAPTTELEDASIILAKISELMPCVIIVEGFTDSSDFLSIDSSHINDYKNIASYEITESCRTKIMLKGDIESEIIAFRPKLGGKEHYAIMVGNASKNPLIRVHSSCYTGDLLDSLACDCHDQLHEAIDLMAKNDGGVILYMLQEGRGIGLINKLRAYTLKEQGFDTVDANEALGFDDDERLFLPAAQILKQLKIIKVKLLTNNPKKAQGLQECGIEVSKCVPHIMQHNVHNEQYLKTKVKRLGHKMNDNK